MEKVCIKCGEITTSDGEVEICVHCGAKLNAPLEELVDGTPKAVGTQTQPIVVVSYILALVNFILGPTCAVVTVFCPMMPPKLFQAVPFMWFFYYSLAQPIVALVCLVLNTVAMRSYNPEKHSPKNLRLKKLSHSFCEVAVLFWIIIVIVGVGLTFYNIKIQH